MVSNCVTHSQREVYVAELQKHIPVDVHGGCGDFDCPIQKEEECLQYLDLNYKFYLRYLMLYLHMEATRKICDNFYITQHHRTCVR